MCGINGFLNYSDVALADEENLIRRMNRAINHRGPDATGLWIHEKRHIGFGHLRLSILDLSPNGRQPMSSPLGTMTVFNGEIYNFKSLRAGLPARKFFSETDTEVLLYLYERDGVDCLRHLQGMFAFAIWDEESGELFLARDRIGIKPLYYTTLNGVFAFSSEIKALLTLPWVKAELDEEALYHFLTFNKVAPPQTMFRTIHKFHPGYKMIVGGKGVKVYEPYWEVSYSDYSALNGNKLEELVFTELQKTVRSHMVSDVPVGAFLSGGVDSSSIVALMSQSTAMPIKTYSIGFADAPGYDELVHARKISQQFGTQHFEKVVTPQDIEDFLPRIVDIYDEPLVDATSIPFYFISQLARENGTIVVLTGDGADELFCGYRNWMRYAKLYPVYQYYTKLPLLLRTLTAYSYGLFKQSSPHYEILQRAVKKQEFFWGGAGGFKETTKRLFLSSDFIARIKKLDSYTQVLAYRHLFDSIPKNGSFLTAIDWLCFLGIKEIIPNFYLYRADHLGMANSIEIRVPFLDHHFATLALSITSEWKIRQNEPKYILKKSLEKILPIDILYRKKQGFCVPRREWTGKILNYIEENSTGFCRETGLFNEFGLRQQIKQAQAGNTDYTSTLWSLYFLIVWFRKWLL